MPRIDRELRVALAAVVLLSIAAGAAAWWALREPPTPVIDRTPLEDPPEVKRELARQLAARRKKQPGPARPEPRPAARKTITLRPLPQAARVQSLAEARKLPPASFDLAYTALLVARLANPQLDLERQLKQLDELAQAILLTLPARTSALETTGAIARYLFDRLGFKYHEGGPDGVDPHNAYLDRVLADRQGYCLTLSLLYLALGERMGLPLVIVELPDHVFVRYEGKPAYFNIESTAKGKNLSDAEYARRHPFPEQAAKYYLRSRKPRTTIAFLLLSHGLLLWQADRVADARKAFVEGLNWDPGNLYLTYNLANVELKQERWEAAARLYETFLERRPDKAIGWLGLARAQLALGQLDDADQSLARGVEQDSGNEEIRLIQAELAYRRKQYGRVDKLLRGPLGNQPTGQYLRAQSYMKTGKNAEAAKLLRALLLQQPERWLFKRKLAHCLARLGQTVEAASLLESVLVKQPRDVYALATLGMFAYRRKQFGRAVTLFQRALAEDPDDEVIYNNLATCQLGSSDAAGAARTAARGLRRFPRSLRLARLAGLTYLNQLKDPVSARRFLAHYKRLGGTDKDILRWLARKR